MNFILEVNSGLGREVSTIFSSPWGRIGGATYKVEWDGSNYPRGVYFYRIAADDLTETRKMIMIK